MIYRLTLLFVLIISSQYSRADGFAVGVPVSIQRTDFNDLHLILIKLDSPVSLQHDCDSGDGLVVHDSNESSKAALNLATTALVTEKKFSCYIRTNGCSRVTGAFVTFPVCEYYPTLSN